MTLGKAACALFLAGLGYLTAQHYSDRLGVFWTAAIVLASVSLAGYGIVMGAAVIGQVLADWRAGWAYPDLRKLEYIRSMSDQQLEIVANYGLVTVEGVPVDGGLRWLYRAPYRDLTREEVADLYAYSMNWPAYPELPTQVGMSDNDARLRLRAFVYMIEAMNLAHRPNGSQRPAVWLKDPETVMRVLEVERDRPAP